MSPETFSAITAALLSLLFSYVPGFKTWYQPLSPTAKRLIMLILLALVAAVSLALVCAGSSLNQRSAWHPNLTCDQGGVLALIQSLLAALVANQATFLITPKPAVKISARRQHPPTSHPPLRPEPIPPHPTPPHSGDSLPARRKPVKWSRHTS